MRVINNSLCLLNLLFNTPNYRNQSDVESCCLHFGLSILNFKALLCLPERIN